MEPLTQKLLKLLVTLEENHNMLQSGVELICSAIHDIIITFVAELEKNVDPNLRQALRNAATKLMEKGFINESSTQHKLKKLLRNHCGLVEPEEVILGETYQVNPSGKEIDQSSLKAYVVPFKKNLESLMNNSQMNKYINDSYRASEDSIIRSVKDGVVWRDHPVRQKHGDNCLVVQVYADDVELVNPLGSRTKVHKLTMIYWTILNTPNFLRSNLNSINLLAIAKAADVKQFGYDGIFSDFFEAIKELESENGLELTVHGQKKTYFGFLISMNGDGLALNSIGGFKESFSFSLKPCRNCNLTRQEMASVFVEQSLRCWQDHKDQLEELENDCDTAKEKTNKSRDFGVSKKSVFLQLQNFDLTRCLPQDSMHNLLEGTAEVEARALINVLLQTHEDFNLEVLNHKIKSFPYPNELKDSKPSLIEKSHLDNRLRQNASQMACLLFTFPMMLNPFINENNQEHFDNFTLLVNIISRLLAYEVYQPSLRMLRFMILLHNTRFTRLYPSISITPKMHFMVHAPTVIQDFGPSRVTWCMRYEAMNAWFKKSAQGTKNFINIAKTLSTKFQIRRCMELGFGDKNSMYIDETEFSFEEASSVHVSDYVLGKEVAAQLGICSEVNSKLQGASRVTIKAFTMKIGSVLMLKNHLDALPTFGRISALFVKAKECAVVCDVLETLSFHSSKFAFDTKTTNNFVCINVRNIPTLQTLPAIQNQSSVLIIPTYLDVESFSG